MESYRILRLSDGTVIRFGDMKTSSRETEEGVQFHIEQEVQKIKPNRKSDE